MRQGHEAFGQHPGGGESFPEEYTYLLPREEAFAKFAAKAAYGGKNLLKWHQDLSAGT